MTNSEKILRAILDHPEGLDDDELSTITRVQPRQQVFQLCTRLEGKGQIRRESIDKPGKRRKIHNFPGGGGNRPPERGMRSAAEGPAWHSTLSALGAATGRPHDELLQEALEDLAFKVLKARTT